MRQVGRVHRANEGDVVHLPGEVRQHVRYPHAAPAMPGELIGAAHEGTGVLYVFDLAGDLVEVLLAVMLVEHRLGIKQVHLTGAAVHEKMDNGRGLGREVRRARPQVEGESSLGCRRRRRTVKIARQQIGQRGAVDAARNLAEEASP